MRRWFRPALARSIFLAAALGAATGALAQGVTGSAVTGVVRDPDGNPVPEASVQLRNPATGDTYDATTGADGVYSFDNVRPGGPYNITVVAGGYEPKTQEGLRTSLGQRLTLDIPIKYFGEEMVMISHADQLDDRNRTGVQARVKEQTIEGLPLAGRNFTDLVTTTPLVAQNSPTSGGITIAGQNNRYNNIQIDGGANNDLFGLANSGTPGGQANARPISIEAVQEFQVQVAPFDVRQGMFAGGLVNAITKSGTNDFHGSLFGYYQSKGLSNQNAFVGGNYQSDPTYTGFYSTQFGGTLGGPIIKDKVHFFLSADIQQKQTAYGSSFQLTGDPTQDVKNVGFTTATAQRFIDDLANIYGIKNVGSYTAPKLANPDRNIFAKVTANNVIPSSQLELSYTFVNANLDILGRTSTAPSATNLRDGYQLSNSGYTQGNTTNTGRAKLTSNFDGGRLSNELIASASFVRDARDTPTDIPLILVKAGTKGASDAWLAAGAERFSQANILDQNIFQLQDNLTYALGAHRITVGTSNEFFHFRNLFLQASVGAWEFNSLAEFEAGTPAVFERRFGGDPSQEAGTAKFNVSQLGVYVQDEWSLPAHISIQPGVRLDVPLLSNAVRNTALLNSATLPIDTAKVPSGNLLWSPRLGFNWDVDGTNDTVLRGGAGVFTGRPPYVWVSNQYANNGISQVQLRCTGAQTPAFSANPAAQPSACANGGTAQSTIGEIDYFDPNTKYPQNLRFDVGVDRRLPFGIVATADFLYTRDVNGWYITDANLREVGVSGEGRPLYGSFAATGFAATSSRFDTQNVRQAVEVYNKNGGHVLNASFQLTKTIGQILTVSASYTYSRSRDRISMTSSQAFSNFQFSPVDGELSNRAVRPSAFDRPHRVTLTGTAALPYGFGVGLSYTGQSGLPYTWTVNGDVNADGVNGNDLVYVPRDQSQITLSDPTQFAALNSFIDGQSCLKDARGGFVQRGACRNPWQNFFDMRFTWTSPPVKGASRFEVQWDIFNVLNLINKDWGHLDQVTPFENAQTSFLRAVGYDAVNKRPIYSFVDPGTVVTTVYTPQTSRWRMQLGARYMF